MAIPRHGLGLRELAHAARYAALPAASRCGLIAVGLLPRPAWGWRLQVRLVQDELLAEHAERHAMTLNEYRSAAHRRMREWLKGADVRVRMDASLVERFIDDGRYRSQFEVGTSGGLFHPALRIILEQSVLGIPPGARKRDRPVYGYLGGTDEEGRVQQYGDVVVILRPTVRWRTTFTFGDSLDATVASTREPLFAAAAVARPSTLALDPRIDVLAAATVSEAVDPAHGYIEAQIHGPLTPHDVREMVFTLNQTPDASTTQSMEASSISWRTVEGSRP